MRRAVQRRRDRGVLMRRAVRTVPRARGPLVPEYCRRRLSGSNARCTWRRFQIRTWILRPHDRGRRHRRAGHKAVARDGYLFATDPMAPNAPRKTPGARTRSSERAAQASRSRQNRRMAEMEPEADEAEGEEKQESDYLSPFLPPMIAGQSITSGQAFEVRDKALRALQDRLIERANIIQARHDEQTALLAKRQANFQRDRDTMNRHEEEEYERECDEAMFRIQILEQRLKRHEEQALQRFYDLDAKLRQDPRLAFLLVQGG